MSENVKHTPGPWASFPTPNDPDFTHEVVGSMQGIATVYAANSASFANARLIAAAPELLAACLDLLGQFDQAHSALSVDRSPSAQEAIAQAKAAIAKATGATP